jgi:MSHA biogenesis protein MshJ
MNYFSSLSQKWVVLSKRDRGMLFAVGLFAIAGLTDTYLTNPVRVEVNTVQEDLQRVQQDTAKTKQELASLQSGAQQVISPLKQQMNTLQHEIDDQKTQIAQVSGMMVSPSESVEIVKKLLLKHKDIQVLVFETLPPESFLQKHIVQALDAKQDTSVPTPTNFDGVYQHGIRLQLNGSYAALLQYVADLKKLGNQIAWESAELKAKYPVNELTLVIYTLSPQRVWMGI